MAKSFKTLKIAFIGGGINSAIGRTHFTAIGLDKKYQLIGGCFSRDLSISRQTALSYGLEEDKGFDDVESLLEHSKPDVVSVLTPTPSHLNCLQSLASSGVPVICDKPLVGSLAELKKLDQSFPISHPIFITYNYTGYPMVREARDIIEHGELGKITQVILEMPQDGFVRAPRASGQFKPPQRWRLNDGVIPSVCLDLSSHLIQMMRFLTNEEVESASSVFATHSRYSNIVDTAQFVGVLTNGATVSLWVTKSAHGYRNGLNFRIFGDRGSLFWDQNKPEILTIGEENGRLSVIDRSGANHEACEPRYDRMKPGHPAGYIEAFGNYYSDVHDKLCRNRATKNFVFDRDDAYEELQLMESLVKGGTYVRECKERYSNIFECKISTATEGNRLGRAN